MKRYAFFAALALLLLVPSSARAQLGAGLNVQYGTDAEEFQIGGELHIPIPSVAGFTFVPNLEVYLQDEPSVLVFNGDFHYAPSVSPQASIRPYIGLGLALTRVEFDRRDNTEAGINIKGGINFRTTGSLVPFFQAEYRAGDYDDISIGGGIRFLLD